MPQNILENLKRAALSNVPKPTPVEREAWDAQAAQKQASDPTWKKIGRNVFDGVTQAFSDPMSADPNTTSMGGKLGMLAASLPAMPKKLPIITPEAYNDVKAGGLRLYSRLTDAFGKAPKVMNPDKIRSVAAQGASKEEISYRKLEDLLKGRNPMDKIAREDVMAHLAANPIELDVVRKGGQGKTIVENDVHAGAQEEFRRFQHELDTRYGQGWQGPMITTSNPGEVHVTPQEWQQFIDLEKKAQDADNFYATASPTQYDWLQTPGPKENYSETLINLPKPASKGLDEDGIAHYAEPVFQSSHWDEPNNLVFSRANDRVLGNTEPLEFSRGDASDLDNLQMPAIIGKGGGSKGRFVEEIQSDWHQQGRERGYRGDPLPEHRVFQDNPEAEFYGERPRFAVESDFFPASMSSYTGSPEESLELFRQGVEHARVPDAPYKDTYHELALKQQLLDAANDPDAEWFGVADADTVSKMEGHTKHLGDPNVKPGIESFYNQRHPSALERLLKPYGGEVEYDNLPSRDVIKDRLGVTGQLGMAPKGKVTDYRPTVQGDNAFSFLPGKQGDGDGIVSRFDYADKHIPAGRPVPGEGMWKAKLTPEMKAAIKERGFPAMLALLATQLQEEQ